MSHGEQNHMTHKIVVFLSTLVAIASTGCAGNVPFLSAKVDLNETVAAPPGEVNAFLSVRDGTKPVAHLSRDNFEIYENGVRLSNEEIGLRLLPRDEVSDGFTVLLLDLSGSPSQMELTRIARGAAQFVEKVSTTQPVAVVAFDGSERAREVARFARVDAPVKRAVPALGSFLSGDTSRDLNSAFIAAVQGVTEQLEQSPKEAKFGTVVTLARGQDLAGRKTDNDVRSAVTVSGFEFYSISPLGVKVPTRQAVGKTAHFTYDTLDTLPMRLADLGQRVRASWFAHYLISYCSPARAGERRLKIKVRFEGEGGGKKSGSALSQFDASSFSGGCAQHDPSAATQRPSAGTTSGGRPRDEQVQATSRKGSPPPPPPAAQDVEETPTVVAPPSSGKYE